MEIYFKYRWHDSLKVLKILDFVSFVLSIYYTPFCIPKNKFRIICINCQDIRILLALLRTTYSYFRKIFGNFSSCIVLEAINALRFEIISKLGSEAEYTAFFLFLVRIESERNAFFSFRGDPIRSSCTRHVEEIKRTRIGNKNGP